MRLTQQKKSSLIALDLVDFAVGLVNSVLNEPTRKANEFFEKTHITENL